MTDQPTTVEPMPVQLTRMEGTINLIAYQMVEVKDDVKGVKDELAGLTARVSSVELAQAGAGDVQALAKRLTSLEHLQAAASGSSAFLKTWLPTILTAGGLAAALGFGIKFGG